MATSWIKYSTELHGMQPWFWTGRQLGLFWIGSILVTVLLLGAATLRGGAQYFWLIPYPNSPRMVFALLHVVFTRWPLEAVALLVVPTLSVVISLVWLLARAWR